MEEHISQGLVLLREGLEDPQVKGTRPKHAISCRSFELVLEAFNLYPTISFERCRSVNIYFGFVTQAV